MIELTSIKKELAMPNIKSAKKRVLVSARRKEENRYVKSTMATMIKNFRVVVGQDVQKAEAMLVDITSYIDSAKSKGVIHANTASRKIARLNLLLNKAKAASESKEQPTETEEKPKKTRAKKVEE